MKENLEHLVLTEAERRFLEYLKLGPATCATIGDALWGKHGRKPQVYARAAGKVLRELYYRGLGNRVGNTWTLDALGRRALRRGA